MNAFGLIPLILIFPAIGFLFNALVGRRFVDSNRAVGEKWSGWFASGMALSALVIAILQLLSLVAHDYHAEVITLFDWIKVGSFQVPWAFQVDTLSVTMMLVVTGVGSLIHIYAIGYMHGDPDFSRFFAYLNLFLFFMLILVTGNNYLMLFVGWEGVGLCSFLLIGFWFDRTDEKGQAMNANAARKAFVANRVGDLAMILAMCLTFWTFGTLTFTPVFEGAVEMFQSGEMVEFGLFSATLGQVLTAITALFLMGAAGKSAQIPLYIWLPDAMAGPTPVSALIHAATMVTSGIYLIVRSNVLFEIVRVSDTFVFGSITSPDLVAYIGAATAILAGLIAFTQFDIKKVLAYSTVSQLGFMIAAAGMGAYVAAMFHLVTHAFFKALLFLSSGSVIHGMEHGHHSLHAHGHGGGGHDDHHGDHHTEEKFDPQDMRTMGGLRNKMPITFAVYMIGTLALAGIVPLAGFWSKDEILAHGSEHNQIVYWMLVFAAFCTAFYMGRQIKMTFFGEARHEAASHAHESSPLMTTPLIILAILTLGGGLLNLPYLSEGAADAGGNHPSGINLAMEGWLEHSIQSFELSEVPEGKHTEGEAEGGDHAEAHGLLHLPHTPIVLSPMVAGISTALALLALGASFFGVYGSRPRTAHERDPLQGTPIWWFAVLPINTVVMKGIIPVFNAAADWLAHKLDGSFWHDFFHERFIRDNFVGFAKFSANVLDQLGVDGLVNGSAKLTRRFADAIRTTQTGNVSGYALGVFIGVVALVVYFFMQTN